MKYLSLLMVAFVFVVTGCVSSSNVSDHWHDIDMVHHHDKIDEKIVEIQYLSHHMRMQSNKLYNFIRRDIDPDVDWQRATATLKIQSNVIVVMIQLKIDRDQGRPTVKQVFHPLTILTRLKMAKAEIDKLWLKEPVSTRKNLLMDLDIDCDLLYELIINKFILR